MKNGARTAVRDFIADTVQETYPLTVTQNCHITNNTFDTSGGTPKATSVNSLGSNNLYCGSPLSVGQGTPSSATASKEVIIPGGAFNTPQLLKLSGIGPADELRSSTSQLSASSLELDLTCMFDTRFPSM
jgi:choline dehydrogenase